jgi:hypothetical protein
MVNWFKKKETKTSEDTSNPINAEPATLFEVTAEMALNRNAGQDIAEKLFDLAKNTNLTLAVAVNKDITPTTADGQRWSCRLTVAIPVSSSILLDRAHLIIKTGSLGSYTFGQKTGNIQEFIKNHDNKAFDFKIYKKQDTATQSSEKEETVESYSGQVKELLTLGYPYDKFDADMLNLAKELAEKWFKNDEVSTNVIKKILSNDFSGNPYEPSGQKINNSGNSKLMQATIRMMLTQPQKAVDTLLSVLRDPQGNLVITKQPLYYRDVKQALENLALAGIETDRLLYEFIAISTKMVKQFPNSGGDVFGVGLYNIKTSIFNGDEKAMLATVTKPLSEEEKAFLRGRGFKTVQ